MPPLLRFQQINFITTRSMSISPAKCDAHGIFQSHAEMPSMAGVPKCKDISDHLFMPEMRLKWSMLPQSIANRRHPLSSFRSIRPFLLTEYRNEMMLDDWSSNILRKCRAWYCLWRHSAVIVMGIDKEAFNIIIVSSNDQNISRHVMPFCLDKAFVNYFASPWPSQYCIIHKNWHYNMEGLWFIICERKSAGIAIMIAMYGNAHRYFCLRNHAQRAIEWYDCHEIADASW